MRRVVGRGVAVILMTLGGSVFTAPAEAGNPIALALPQGDAFSILGHSCGGIQEQTYATGFGAGGLPGGDVYMQTRCGGSGRGGGYKTTTYSAWADVVWDWFGATRSFSRLEGTAERTRASLKPTPTGTASTTSARPRSWKRANRRWWRRNRRRKCSRACSQSKWPKNSPRSGSCR